MNAELRNKATKALCVLCLLFCVPSGRAQSSNKVFTLGTNNVLRTGETNFFAVNSNLLNQAIIPITGYLSVNSTTSGDVNTNPIVQGSIEGKNGSTVIWDIDNTGDADFTGSLVSGSAGQFGVNTAGYVTAPGYSGPLTGNVMGNVSGTATNTLQSIPQMLNLLALIYPTNANTPSVMWLNAKSATNAIAAQITNLNGFTNQTSGPFLASDSQIGNYLNFFGTNYLWSATNLYATNQMVVMTVYRANQFGTFFPWTAYGRNDTTCSIFSQINKGIDSFQSLTGSSAATMPDGLAWMLVTCVFDSTSNMTIRINGAVVTNSVAGNNIGSWLPFEVGGLNHSYGLQGGVAELAIWTNTLDATTLQQQEMAMLFRNALFPRSSISFIGDSIIADATQQETNYGFCVMNDLNPSHYLGTVFGLTGDGLGVMANMANVPDWQFLGQQKIDVIAGGVNDFQAGTGSNAVLILASNACASYRAKGHKVIYCTPTGCASPDGTTVSIFDNNRTNFIKMCESNWISWCDGLADLGSDPVYGTQSASSNSAWFVSGIHPTSLVYQALAPYIVNAILGREAGSTNGVVMTYQAGITTIQGAITGNGAGISNAMNVSNAMAGFYSATNWFGTNAYEYWATNTLPASTASNWVFFTNFSASTSSYRLWADCTAGCRTNAFSGTASSAYSVTYDILYTNSVANGVGAAYTNAVSSQFKGSANNTSTQITSSPPGAAGGSLFFTQSSSTTNTLSVVVHCIVRMP